jgi:hypothetical protein
MHNLESFVTQKIKTSFSLLCREKYYKLFLKVSIISYQLH